MDLLSGGGTTLAIAFGIGMAAGGLLIFMVLHKLMGDEGWQLASARMKNAKKGRLFMVVEANNKTHFEFARKKHPDDPCYELRNGVLAYDPSQHDSEAPLLFSRGLECYECTPQTPMILGPKQSLFIKRMVLTCRARHPELDGVLSDSELISLITTERADLWHDVAPFCKPPEIDDDSEDDEFDDENPNETAEVIWGMLEGKDTGFQNIVMNTVCRNLGIERKED